MGILQIPIQEKDVDCGMYDLHYYMIIVKEVYQSGNTTGINSCSALIFNNDSKVGK